MAMNYCIESYGKPAVAGEESWVGRIIDTVISADEYFRLKDSIDYIGVTTRFKDVINTFRKDPYNTPTGFKRELTYSSDRVLRVDLVRDISYDSNGVLRPTNVLFSADSANPYEIAPMKGLIANLTCNPGIIYDLFINNPKANVGNKFKNRDEVMVEIAEILGPGVDISVELNNPFEKDFNLLLEEAERFKEILSPYRVVIKVPHTGVVNAANVNNLLVENKKLAENFKYPATEDAFASHNLCLKFKEHGYRINYTLMFEPYQTQLALQAKPYFINTFLRQRLVQSETIHRYLSAYEATKDAAFLKNMRQYLYDIDYFNASGLESDLLDVYREANALLAYRKFDNKEGLDGLDGMRHNLRCLKNCNLEDTRLIVCSMEGENNYPDIDRLLCEPEFSALNKKVVITTEPGYFARFTSTHQVVTYQRRFMNAAKGQA
ncbi:transaldolase family protein [Citrobacter portucalensis]|uniref:transaldolase family protein n=1 Tax=Citrobacter portucalensis TaxID=1639133 RepID=UPI003A865E1B